MEGGLINPLAPIRTGAAEGVTSVGLERRRFLAEGGRSDRCQDGSKIVGHI